MSKILNDNANVVSPEHSIEHNPFGGVAYVPVSSVTVPGTFWF